MPNVIFTQPFLINAALADQCGSRTVVLDIAFNAGRYNPAQEFAQTTEAFIDALGSRLVAWVDHHDHKQWPKYANDSRFVLVPRANAAACPPILTPDLVASFDPSFEVDTIVCHGDLDGILSACTWMHGGYEPYEGSYDDSIAADSRVGVVGPVGQLIEAAVKSNVRDDSVRQDVFSWLVYNDEEAGQRVKDAAEKYNEVQRITNEIARNFVVNGKVAFVDASEYQERFDRTALLLAGQRVAPVAIVLYIARYVNTEQKEVATPMIAVAAPYPWNFRDMFGLTGGAQNVVTLPVARLQEAIELINR